MLFFPVTQLWAQQGLLTVTAVFESPGLAVKPLVLSVPLSCSVVLCLNLHRSVARWIVAAWDLSSPSFWPLPTASGGWLPQPSSQQQQSLPTVPAYQQQMHDTSFLLPPGVQLSQSWSTH